LALISRESGYFFEFNLYSKFSQCFFPFFGEKFGPSEHSLSYSVIYLRKAGISRLQKKCWEKKLQKVNLQKNCKSPTRWGPGSWSHHHHRRKGPFKKYVILHVGGMSLFYKCMSSLRSCSVSVMESDVILVQTVKTVVSLGKLLKYRPVLHSLTTRKVSTNLWYLDCVTK